MADLIILSPGPIAQIGDALIARLKLVFPPEKFEHQFVPAKLDGSAWSKLLRRTPFVGLGFADLEQTQQGGSQFVGTVRWALFLVTKNERDPYSRFFGDRFAPGVLQLMQAAVGMLQGYTLMSGTTKLGTIGVHAAQNSYADDWKDEALAAVQLVLSLPVTFSVPDVLGGDAAVPGTLDGTQVKWSFDGGATFPLTDTTTGGV